MVLKAHIKVKPKTDFSNILLIEPNILPTNLDLSFVRRHSIRESVCPILVLICQNIYIWFHRIANFLFFPKLRPHRNPEQGRRDGPAGVHEPWPRHPGQSGQAPNPANLFNVIKTPPLLISRPTSVAEPESRPVFSSLLLSIPVYQFGKKNSNKELYWFNHILQI
jgi:hypothetical protein